MPAPPPVMRACPICEQTLDADARRCPSCSADEDWLELAEAYTFVRRRFEQWHDQGRITTAQWGRLQDFYNESRTDMRRAVQAGEPVMTGVGYPPKLQCWSCRDHMDQLEPRCPACGVIQQTPGVRSLRCWKFLAREIQQHLDRGRISLVQAHEFESEAREKMAALRGRLELDRVSPMEMPRPPKIKKPHRPLLEILLDPQSIQWLLASGGALLVLGLIIWLTSLGIFENKKVVAVALGLGNGVLLAGGFALIRFTRFQIAGRSLTLLACLVMPLNLWFYQAQNLITYQDHLWIAGLVCCIIYAASAATLRDHLFVYVFCAGIALTGLLLLANQNHFAEIAAPSTLLVVLGLMALHLERVFPEMEGPFSRQRFGMAFFWSAQALLGAGLLLLLGAQLFGWLPLWREFGMARPVVVDKDYLSWTILLTLAGTYAYIWSDLVVRRIGVYIYFAAIALLWSEVQLLVLLGVSEQEPIVLMSLALTALIVNLLHATVGQGQSYTRAVPPLGLALSLVPVVYGVLLHFRATNAALNQGWPGFDITAAHVAAMVVTALACRAGAYFYRHSMPVVTSIYFFATAAATLVAAAGFFWLVNVKPWELQAPLLMVVPILYLVAARLYRGHSPEEPLIWVGHASTVVMMICTLFAAVHFTEQVVKPIEGETRNLLFALFCAEAAVFYGLAASFRKEGWNVYLATLLACGALWQLLIYWEVRYEYYTVIFALAGMALLVVYRLAVLESTNWSGLATAAFQSANGLLSLGFLSGALVTLTRLAMNEVQLGNLPGAAGVWRQPIYTLMFILVLLGILGLFASLLVRHTGWRRFYLVLAIGDALLIAACIHKVSQLTPWQKLEIFSVALGLLLLVVGHIGWYREDERQNDLVSFSLVVGCLLVTVPLLIAILVHRFFGDSLERPRYVSWPDELGLILAGVALLGFGIMCRLKANTLIGGTALGVYLLIVIGSLYRFLDESWIIGISLTVGGGLLFAIGIFLSVYRDRLLELPEKIKRREGLFKILSWR